MRYFSKAIGFENSFFSWFPGFFVARDRFHFHTLHPRRPRVVSLSLGGWLGLAWPRLAWSGPGPVLGPRGGYLEIGRRARDRYQHQGGGTWKSAAGTKGSHLAGSPFSIFWYNDMKWDMPGRISKKYLSQTSEASLFVPAGKFPYKCRPKKPEFPSKNRRFSSKRRYIQQARF